MAQVTKPYTFANQTTADAGQVNQDFDALYALVNGNIDSTNMKDSAVTTPKIATEAVTPAKTEGLPYAQDVFGSGFVLSGLTVTKDGTNANQVDVTAGVVYIKQSDGSLRRFAPVATNFRTSSASNTYYLDFQPDGTWWWNTGHSPQANYINVATVTSDASSNVNVVTQNTSSSAITLLSGATGPVKVAGTTVPQVLSGGYKIQSGFVTMANGASSATLTYPTAYTTQPAVTVASQNNTYIFIVQPGTSTATIYTYNGATVSGSQNIPWIAIGT